MLCYVVKMNHGIFKYSLELCMLSGIVPTQTGPWIAEMDWGEGGQRCRSSAKCWILLCVTYMPIVQIVFSRVIPLLNVGFLRLYSRNFFLK